MFGIEGVSKGDPHFSQSCCCSLTIPGLGLVLVHLAVGVAAAPPFRGLDLDGFSRLLEEGIYIYTCRRRDDRVAMAVPSDAVVRWLLTVAVCYPRAS